MTVRLCCCRTVLLAGAAVDAFAPREAWMTSEFGRQPNRIRRRPRTRKNVLAITAIVTAVFFLALFGIYEALPGRLAHGGAPATATSPATTFYYSDGKTVLG